MMKGTSISNGLNMNRACCHWPPSLRAPSSEQISHAPINALDPANMTNPTRKRGPNPAKTKIGRRRVSPRIKFKKKNHAHPCTRVSPVSSLFKFLIASVSHFKTKHLSDINDFLTLKKDRLIDVVIPTVFSLYRSLHAVSARLICLNEHCLSTYWKRTTLSKIIRFEFWLNKIPTMKNELFNIVVKTVQRFHIIKTIEFQSIYRTIIKRVSVMNEAISMLKTKFSKQIINHTTNTRKIVANEAFSKSASKKNVTAAKSTRSKSVGFSNKNCVSKVVYSWLLLVSVFGLFISGVRGGLTIEPEEEEVLHIGGIFPIGGEGGWQGGQACMPAANLALEDVNKRKDILPGFQLRLHSNDSECEPGLGASVMYNLLYNPPQKLLLLAGCSTVCTTVAEAAKMWNLMVLCYGASSPALSDRRRFPTLFRTHPSATVHNPTRITLMRRFGWSRVAILQQAEEVFISTVEDLEARCKEAGIEIVTRQSFLSDPGDAVRNLRRQDARIIVGLFYVVAARRVLCDLYKHQLYGSSYVWFFIGWYEDNWFEVNLEREGVECTAEQMRLAAEGHLTTEALMWNQNQHQPTISGMTSEDFRLRLNAVLRDEGYDIDNLRYPEGYQEAPLAYDAVWAVALAFNKTMERLSKTGRSLKNFTYTDKDIADNIYAAINSTSFLGVSGIVAFSSQGDRIALTQIEQMIGGQYVKLGYYDTQADNLTWLNREKWAGGKVPQDRTVVRRELRTVSLPLFACVTAVAAAGVCVAAGLVVFNVWNSHRRVIQSSHPVCNTLMLCGCALCLAGLVALGADGRFVPADNFGAVCQARVWLLSLGFTLAYGAMFSKVWRVHRFTTKAKVDPKKKVEPWKLYTMVSGLLVIDTIILLSWQLRDPLRRRVELFPLEDPPSALDDVKIRPELEHCESEHNTVWLGVMYGYKGLVLVFGLFLAYETRSIKLRQINDSRYVGMSIYNVVVLCLITAPVSMVVASQQDASFAFVSLAVVFCCFLSMALIFVPKVIEVIRHPKDRAESKYNPDAGMSKEDEERYHKLLAENDQLQQLIAAKEEKIRTLKQKIAERDGQRPGGGGVTVVVPGQTAVPAHTTIPATESQISNSDIQDEHI